MSIDTILKRIEEETESAVAEIQEQSNAEAFEIKSRFAAVAAELESELLSRAEKKAHEEERRLIVSEQLELRKARLQKKRDILDGLYAAARARIESLPQEEYIELVAGIVTRKAVSGREEIIVPETQQRLFGPAFIDRLSREFPGEGAFSYADERRSFTWGVVMREGQRIVDCSLDVLFEQLKAEIEPQIAAELFTEAKE
jgi:V/A-type H+-transporting ATPase subunit E